jgi:hypothetical protein
MEVSIGEKWIHIHSGGKQHDAFRKIDSVRISDITSMGVDFGMFTIRLYVKGRTDIVILSYSYSQAEREKFFIVYDTLKRVLFEPA